MNMTCKNADCENPRNGHLTEKDYQKWRGGYLKICKICAARERASAESKRDEWFCLQKKWLSARWA